MNEPLIENGFARAEKGLWLVSQRQPAAAVGSFSVKGLKGFIVPDRKELQTIETEGSLYLSCNSRPFLTHLTCTDVMSVVSSKILLAPFAARKEGKLVRVIPMSFRESFAVTRFASDWIVTATKSRIKRIVLAEGEIACVKPESAVAWTGKDPLGVASRIRIRDIFIPKVANKTLSLDFYGPQTIWVEGANGI